MADSFSTEFTLFFTSQDFVNLIRETVNKNESKGAL